MSFQKFNEDCRAFAHTLAKQFPDGTCLVVSVTTLDRNSTPGNVCEVPLDTTARLLVEGTHRLATDEEAKAWESQNARGALTIGQSSKHLRRA